MLFVGGVRGVNEVIGSCLTLPPNMWRVVLVIPSVRARAQRACIGRALDADPVGGAAFDHPVRAGRGIYVSCIWLRFSTICLPHLSIVCTRGE
jgi:hypothetical protein